MADHRVICVVEQTIERPAPHTHIVGIGTGSTLEQVDRRWTLAEFLQAFDSGDRFYTCGRVSGRTAPVGRTTCPQCGEPEFGSGAEAVPDNELRSLRLCVHNGEDKTNSRG